MVINNSEIDQKRACGRQFFIIDCDGHDKMISKKFCRGDSELGKPYKSNHPVHKYIA